MRTVYRPIARRARADYIDYDACPVAETVYEQDDDPVETGILDQHGTMLYRTVERDPIGFRRTT